MAAVQDLKKANDELGSWIFPTGISALFLPALANSVHTVNPAANLWDMTFGGFYNFFLSDPNAVLAIDPSMIVPASELATGLGGNAAAGMTGWFNGAVAMKEAAMADIATTGGVLLLSVGLTALLIRGLNKAAEGPSPA